MEGRNWAEGLRAVGQEGAGLVGVNLYLQGESNGEALVGAGLFLAPRAPYSSIGNFDLGLGPCAPEAADEHKAERGMQGGTHGWAGE